MTKQELLERVSLYLDDSMKCKECPFREDCEDVERFGEYGCDEVQLILLAEMVREEHKNDKP